jgi:Sugar kinases, ribokinase family
MGKKYDVMAMGELLIDFTESGVSKNGMKLFEQNPGGAPANLLTTVSHMGYKTAMVGKIGSDMHGNFLKKTLKQEGICTDYIVEDDSVFTTLAFVAINENGERCFSFARKPGADTCLSVSELDCQGIQDCKIFHFGSLSLTDEPARTATIEAVKIAKSAGALISFDPNYRASLWKTEMDAVEAIQSVLPNADMLKISDEESVLLTGKTDCQQAAEELLRRGPKLVAITLGSQGVYLANHENHEQISGFPAEVVDTTGAGDSFWGGFLSKYIEYQVDMQTMSWDNWRACAKFGNATASLCVQKRGGIPAVPMKNEVVGILQR